ncbi:MAG TPA: methyltransferase domain-containing protein [Symbiobacteriaceae bacterium]|nr:methyltransferase domain-containing protein [Symbiobacteriaceae bacterium]
MNCKLAYQRQVDRGYLVPDWLEALQLRPGERVLDVGACTGYVSLILAEQVGPGGHVYAIDREADLLAYFKAPANVTCIVADAAEVHTLGVKAEAAVVTLLLHIVDDPAAVVRSVASALVPGGCVVFAEFHPDGPCAEGARREKRISPETVALWCAAAGLKVEQTKRQSPEHYLVLARIASGTAG